VGDFWQILDLRQHTSKDFEAKVFLISQPVGSTLNHSDLVVEAFGEPEEHLVLWVAEGSDAFPVAFDHQGKLLHRV